MSPSWETRQRVIYTLLFNSTFAPTFRFKLPERTIYVSARHTSPSLTTFTPPPAPVNSPPCPYLEQKTEGGPALLSNLPEAE